MNSMHGNGNRYDGRRKPAEQTSYPKNRDCLRIVIPAMIVNVSIAMILVVLSYVLISSPEAREIYTKLIFIPVTAFAGAFISFLLRKSLLINAACSGFVCFLLYLIFVDFSAWALLWTLFYLLNAFIGFLAALVVRTFH